MTRRYRWPNSLSARMIGLSILVAAIGAAVTLAVSYPLLSQGASARAQANLDSLADVAVAALRAPTDAATVEQLRSEFRATGVTAYVLGPGLGRIPDVDATVQSEVGRGVNISGTTVVNGSEMFLAGRSLGQGYGLLLLLPVDDAEAVAGDDLRRLVIALVVGGLAAVVIGLIAANRVTRPLRRAADVAERMSSGERGLRVAASGPTEVADIAESLNQLGDSLEVSEARQREFLLSVSHELRTPLTAIRGNAEALADGLATDPAASGEVMVAESERLDRLVADLLDLARLGAVDVSVTAVPVDLLDIAKAASAVWQTRCEREGVEFRLDVPARSVVVSADPTRLRQILDNLAENALRVTPAGRPLVIAVAPDGPTGVLAVRDGGPGLSADDMAVAFEPAELHTRYHGIRPVGTGIGLALVQQLAQRMGGVARVWTAPEGGAAFGVWLPLSPEHSDDRD